MASITNNASHHGDNHGVNLIGSTHHGNVTISMSANGNARESWLTFADQNAATIDVSTCLQALLASSVKDPEDTLSTLQATKEESRFRKDMCTWLPEHAKYKEWLRPCRNSLWVSAPPGAGKTMLAMSLVENLSKGDNTVLYFFCDARQATGHIITRSLLYQLLKSEPHLFRHIQKPFELKRGYLFDDNGTEQLWGIIRAMFRDEATKPIRIVIDGLDQCEHVTLGRLLRNLRSCIEHSNHEHASSSSSSSASSTFDSSGSAADGINEQLRRASEALADLGVESNGDGRPSESTGPAGTTQDSSFQSNRHKLIIFSRRTQIQVLEDELQDYPSLLSLRMDEDDTSVQSLRKDIEVYIARKVRHIAKSKKRDWSAPLRDKIRSSLLERAGGTFLWVAYILNDLQSKSSHEVERTLGNLPYGLSDVYHGILKQVEPQRQPVVADILKWIVLAQRPLNLWELSAITGVKAALGDESPIKAVKEQLQFCAPLVVSYTYGDQHLTRLYHDSVRDYLLDTQLLEIPSLTLFRISAADDHALIANFCLTYLEKTLGGPRGIATQTELRRYFCEALRDHVADQQVDNRHAFIPSTPRRQPRILISRDGGERWSYTQPSPVIGSPIPETSLAEHPIKEMPMILYAIRWWTEHAKLANSSESQLITFTRPFFEHWLQEASPVDHRYIYPTKVTAAAWWYLFTCVSDYPADVLPRPNQLPKTHLHLAAIIGSTALTRHILSTKTDSQISEALSVLDHDTGVTPLMYAARLGRTGVVAMLLNHCTSSDLTARDEFGETVLHRASEVGATDVVHLLVHHGADPSLCSKQDQSPALLAAMNGHVDVMQIFLDKHLSLDKRYGQNKMTCLHHAAQEAHPHMVEFLIRHGAQTSVVDRDGKTALFYAVASQSLSGVIETVRTLLRGGADSNVADRRGMPLIHYMELLQWPDMQAEIVTVLKNEGGVSDMGLETQADRWRYLCLMIDELLSDVFPAMAKIMVSRSVHFNVLVFEAAAFLNAFSEYEWLSNAMRERPEMEVSRFDMLHRQALETRVVAEGQMTTNCPDLLHWQAAGMSLGADHRLLGRLQADGWEVNRQDADGRSPLHFAYGGVLFFEEYMKEKIIPALATPAWGEFLRTQYIPRLETTEWEDYTSRFLEKLIEIAKRLAQPKFQADGVKLLIEAGADIDALDSERWSPLLYALFCYTPEVVTVLLDCGCDTDLLRDPDLPVLGLIMLEAVKRGSFDDVLRRLLDIAGQRAVQENLHEWFRATPPKIFIELALKYGHNSLFEELLKICDIPFCTLETISTHLDDAELDQEGELDEITSQGVQARLDRVSLMGSGAAQHASHDDHGEEFGASGEDISNDVFFEPKWVMRQVHIV